MAQISSGSGQSIGPPYCPWPPWEESHAFSFHVVLRHTIVYKEVNAFLKSTNLEEFLKGGIILKGNISEIFFLLLIHEVCKRLVPKGVYTH